LSSQPLNKPRKRSIVHDKNDKLVILIFFTLTMTPTAMCQQYSHVTKHAVLQMTR